MRIPCLLLLGIFSVSQIVAQVNSCALAPHTIPDDLRSSLEQRVSAFVSAQANGDWVQVSELLGSRETSSYKKCLVSRMQELRMLSFDASVQHLSACSTEMELPTGTVPRFAVEQLDWYLPGMGRFQTSSEAWTEETKLIAYREQGKWYFKPPQQQMQNQWEKTHYTETDFRRDRKEEIEVQNSPASPVEITDVHVFMDRKFPSWRNVRFTLRNLTTAKVVGLGMRILMVDNGPGEIDIQGPYQIGPKGELAKEESVDALTNMCGEASKNAMLIYRVEVADGSNWIFKEPANNE